MRRFQPEEPASFPDCDVLVDAHHAELRGGTGIDLRLAGGTSSSSVRAISYSLRRSERAKRRPSHRNCRAARG